MFHITSCLNSVFPQVLKFAHQIFTVKDFLKKVTSAYKTIKKQRNSIANQYDAGLEIHLHASSPDAEHYNTKTANITLKTMGKFKYLRMTITNLHYTHEAITSRLKSRNVCFKTADSCHFSVKYLKLKD